MRMKRIYNDDEKMYNNTGRMKGREQERRRRGSILNTVNINKNNNIDCDKNHNINSDKNNAIVAVITKRQHHKF